MTDTAQTFTTLQTECASAQSGGILAQWMRDLIMSSISVGAAIVATGTNQATAANLPYAWNVIISGGAATGVILDPGRFTMVQNRSGYLQLVYPPSGGALEALGASNPFRLPNGQDALFTFDPVLPLQGYVSMYLNIASLPTTLPASAGIVWNDGKFLVVS